MAKKYSTESLSNIIRETAQEYADDGIPAEEIGNGHCEDFADDVCDRWLGGSWVLEEGGDFTTLSTGEVLANDGLDPDRTDGRFGDVPEGIEPDLIKILGVFCPDHVWITVYDKHYDAEAPDGVDHFLDLPFFQKRLAAIKEDLEHDPGKFEDILRPAQTPTP